MILNLEEKEIWVPIIGHECFYEISNTLKVKSLEQKGLGKDGRRLNHRKEKILKPYISKGVNRYYNVKLRKEKGQKEKTYMLHRLIALHFIPNPLNLPVVNHINGIKTDNRLENLEWCTRSENAKHSIRIGLQIPFKGEENGCSKLTEEQVLEIRSIGKTKTLKNIASMYGVSYTTIWNVIKRKKWSHI